MQEIDAHSLLCELRFDIFLTPQKRETETRQFERAWRAELAAQKKTALAMPPAKTVAARFRIVGPERRPELSRYLQARLAALPGSPSVAPEPDARQADWSGVQIWLSYPAADLAALLRMPQTKVNLKCGMKGQNRLRGHRS